MTTQLINVLIVDDSKVALMLLTRLLEAAPQIRVVGAVKDGQAAVDFVNEKKPDVVVMDINMPNLDGFEATRLIMEQQPVPIVICSATTDPKEVVVTFRMMEAGAVACVEKPLALERPEFKALAAHLVETVKLMSEVKVVRRWPRLRGAARPGVAAEAAKIPRTPLAGIGASTGGPPVIQSILGALGKDFPGAVLIVQHVAKGFLPGMTEWLNQTVGMPVHIAAHGVLPAPGHVYLAPDDMHMGVGASGRILLSTAPPESGLRPAVAFLFRTMAEVCGPDAVGVLLTGMGQDGAAELKLMRDKGAVTIAQDRESSVVHGMPGVAIELGGASHILPGDRIGAFLLSIVKEKATAGGRVI